MQINNIFKNPIKFHKRNPLAIVFNVWYFILLIFITTSIVIGMYVKGLFDHVNNSVYEGNKDRVSRIDKNVPYEKIDKIETFFNKKKENFSSTSSVIGTIGDPSI